MRIFSLSYSTIEKNAKTTEVTPKVDHGGQHRKKKCRLPNSKRLKAQMRSAYAISIYFNMPLLVLFEL